MASATPDDGPNETERGRIAVVVMVAVVVGVLVLGPGRIVVKSGDGPCTSRGRSAENDRDMRFA